MKRTKGYLCATIILVASQVAYSEVLSIAGISADGKVVKGEYTRSASSFAEVVVSGNGIQCGGPLRIIDGLMWASGDLRCEDGATGRIELMIGDSLPYKGELSVGDAEKFQIDVGFGAERVPVEPPLGGGYQGSNRIDGLIVDFSGRNEADIDRDISECRKLRDEADNDPLGDAIGGALVGSALAKLSGKQYSRSKAASAGAAVALVDGAITSDSQKELVLRNCLSGRGYRVLN